VERPNKPKGSPPPVNSVRMDRASLNDLFDEMERRPQARLDPRRAHIRWPFRKETVEFSVQHAGFTTSFYVACRNLSSGGMSVLHNSFLYDGTRVVAMLPEASGKAREVEATVVRCAHVRGVCHEIGLRFQSPIDMRAFVALDVFQNNFAQEAVNPESLRGGLVYVTSSQDEEAPIRSALRDTFLRLRVALSFEEAKSMLDDRADVLLCDHPVNARDAAEAIGALRDQGQTLPVIVFTNESSSTCRERLVRAEVSSVLPKPPDQRTLLRALAEFLVPSQQSGGVVTTLSRGHPTAPKADQFVEAVHAHADSLEKALKTRNFELARTVVLQIASEAPNLGFQPLAQIARATDRSLAATKATDASEPQVRRLMRICRDVRKRAA
jgi:CheY-like chemotaxis protein